MIGLAKNTVLAVGLAIVALAAPRPAAAHCDSMDGPVVKAAQQALATGEVTRVLVWVRAQDEPAIRAAFTRTMAVRKLGGEARGVADLWFFETLVRVHRAGEGEPYTGLKPAGSPVPAGIAAADHALESGSVDLLTLDVGGEIVGSLKERYERVRALGSYAPGDVEAGRHYVHAYVEYIHFVERLHELVHEKGGSHSAPGETIGSR